MGEEQHQIGHGTERAHDQQEHVQRNHEASLTLERQLSNHLAYELTRLYGPDVKNGKGAGPPRLPEDSRSDILGPEIDEALLALDELASEDPEEALATFDTLPEPVQALVDFQLLAARAHQSLGELEAARDILLALLDHHALNADLHHQLGDVLEDLGEVEKANSHFEKTLALDLAAYEQLSPEERSMLALELEQALTKIAKTLESRGLHVSVDTLPSSSDVLLGIDPRALCRYQKDTKHLVGYAGNVAFEFHDLEDDLRQNALLSGLIAYAADELELSNEELELLGFEVDDSEQE
jgi:tetratricopeptide (TPR) repeat protein